MTRLLPAATLATVLTVTALDTRAEDVNLSSLDLTLNNITYEDPLTHPLSRLATSDSQRSRTDQILSRSEENKRYVLDTYRDDFRDFGTLSIGDPGRQTGFKHFELVPDYGQPPAFNKYDACWQSRWNATAKDICRDDPVRIDLIWRF